MLNITKIRCFLYLAETLSFTQAAKRMFFTQQAMSKHISELEEEVGHKLFYRTRRSVKLTAAGERCRDIFLKFINEYDSFLSEFAPEDKKFNVLSLGYLNWVDFGPLPGRALSILQKENPELRLRGERHSAGLLNARLLNGDLDIILTYQRYAPKSRRLKSLEITHTKLLLMVSSDHPLATELANFETFYKLPFIIDAFENENAVATNSRAHEEIRQYGIMPEKIIIVPNRDTVYTAAELGQGIIISSDMCHAAKNSNLKKYPTKLLETVICVWSKGENESVLERYAKLLQQEYAVLNSIK